MTKKFAAIFIIIVVILIALVIWLLFELSGSKETSPLESPSPYSAVYLSTGDIYFGKLSWFPKPHLSGVWYIQKSLDGKNQPQLNLLPFKSVTWAPVDEIFFNPSQIIFWTRLRSDSQIVKVITQSTQSQPPSSYLPNPSSGDNSKSAPSDKTQNSSQ